MNAAREYPKCSGITIREITNRHGSTKAEYNTSFLVTVPSRVTLGARLRKQFANEADAEEWAVEQHDGKTALGRDFFRLEEEDMRDATAAARLLRPLGLSMADVARQAVEVHKILSTTGIPLIDALLYAVPRMRPDGGNKTVRQVVDELVATRKTRKKKSGNPASAKYLKDLEGRLGKFADAFPVEIAAVTPSAIATWLDENKFQGRTRFNYGRLIGTLFSFAKSKQYIHRDVNPLDGVEYEHDDDGEIVIFTHDEMGRLLAAARPELVPYLAIGAFAGLRRSEIQRLDWADIKPNKIEVTKGKAKTRSRRLVPIQPNLEQWLAPYRKESGKVVPFASMSKQLRGCAKDTARDGRPAVTWKHNALRHSFVSYRMEILKDENAVALEAGHSPQKLFSNYRELVSEEAAGKWFAVLPPKQATHDNIVELQLAQGAG